MKIVTYPHPSLRHPAVPLTSIDKRVRLMVGEMLTLMHEGRGLGLATAYSIVRKHDGLIEVESKRDQGATFHVYLPAPMQAVATETEEQNAPQAPQLAGSAMRDTSQPSPGILLQSPKPGVQPPRPHCPSVPPRVFPLIA